MRDPPSRFARPSVFEADAGGEVGIAPGNPPPLRRSRRELFFAHRRTSPARARRAAQMKLGAGGGELGRNFYRKGDGTGCCYFELDDLRELFVNERAGDDRLELLELDYVQRVYRNRGDGTTRRRVWVQGRFRKPLGAAPGAGERGAAVGGVDEPSGALERFLDATTDRWEEYYKQLSPASPSPSLPSNLLQLFPDEFRPWQPPKKKGKRHRPSPSMSDSHTTPKEMTVVDLGCGLGNNTLLNLLERQQPHQKEAQRHQQQGSPLSASDEPPTLPVLNVHFLDASKEAIHRLRGDPRYQRALVLNKEPTADAIICAGTAVSSRVCNLASATAATAHLDETADVVLLLFALSAIGPYRSQQVHRDRPRCSGVINAVRNAANMLKPGGVVLFRDYGRYDDDQLREYFRQPDASRSINSCIIATHHILRRQS